MAPKALRKFSTSFFPTAYYYDIYPPSFSRKYGGEQETEEATL